MKQLCECGEIATYMYMPGDEVYCDKCLPRGCSCNNESFYFGEDAYSKETQIKEFLKGNLKILNYGKKIHEVGKHLEEITDKNLIKNMFNRLTEEELLNLEIIPLDENGLEYPCCEYMQIEI